MVVHHLNCGSMCPVGLPRSSSTSDLAQHASLVCHCLLVEAPDGLVLVDTGIGFQDTMNPARLPFLARQLMRLHLDPNETAARQLPQLGYSVHDVRHIIVTSLDFDHASGLEDFPNAKVHVTADELETAQKPRTFTERTRYRTVRAMRDIDWSPLTPRGEPWFGFEAVRDLPGLPPEILVIPLRGHSVGHSGVAVQTPSGWVMHAGDAYLHHAEVHGGEAPARMLRYQRLLAYDNEARASNVERLRELNRAHGDSISIISSHDLNELEAHEPRTRERKRPRNRLATTQELGMGR